MKYFRLIMTRTTAMLKSRFFNRDGLVVAQELLGKVIRVKYRNLWLSAQIIETEAYFKHEQASHASLGYTKKRKALFMSPGTIYMYYARGGDSLNISCAGEGNAVLIKSAIPYQDLKTRQEMIRIMQRLNPQKNGQPDRPKEKLCSGQTLLCRSLGITVKDWDQKQFDPLHFYIKNTGYRPNKIIQTTRLGIPDGRDEHLMYRFIDVAYADSATQNPITKKQWKLGVHYILHSASESPRD